MACAQPAGSRPPNPARVSRLALRTALHLPLPPAGPQTSELYGKFTWKLERFGDSGKRELRSNVFEVGSFKWWVLPAVGRRERCWQGLLRVGGLLGAPDAGLQLLQHDCWASSSLATSSAAAAAAVAAAGSRQQQQRRLLRNIGCMKSAACDAAGARGRQHQWCSQWRRQQRRRALLPGFKPSLSAGPALARRYLLVYPQGCDVANHLSLFLCVADYDKLLPGWSHFAQVRAPSRLRRVTGGGEPLPGQSYWAQARALWRRHGCAGRAAGGCEVQLGSIRLQGRVQRHAGTCGECGLRPAPACRCPPPAWPEWQAARRAPSWPRAACRACVPLAPACSLRSRRWPPCLQFTIAVVNSDPKKSKYSDTLHRFCKKEHDWGWKKFIELSKVGLQQALQKGSGAGRSSSPSPCPASSPPLLPYIPTAGAGWLCRV